MVALTPILRAFWRTRLVYNVDVLSEAGQDIKFYNLRSTSLQSENKARHFKGAVHVVYVLDPYRSADGIFSNQLLTT